MMHDDLTNLLPQDRQWSIARGYALRLSVVAAVLVSVLAGVSAALLLPTYVFLMQSAGAKEARLASIEAVHSTIEERELSARLAALARDAATLSALKDAPSISGILSTVLKVPRPGITLSGFSYTPAKDKARGTLALSGIAATRDALRSYQLALEETPLALSAALPVSAYAKDADIAFTITVTLAP